MPLKDSNWRFPRQLLHTIEIGSAFSTLMENPRNGLDCRAGGCRGERVALRENPHNQSADIMRDRRTTLRVKLPHGPFNIMKVNVSYIILSFFFFFFVPAIKKKSRNSTQHGAGGDAGPSSDQVANYFKALRRSRLCCRRRTFAGRHHPYRRCLRLLLPLCRYDFATSKMPGVIDPPTPNARNQFHGQKEMGTCAVDAFEIKMIV